MSQENVEVVRRAIDAFNRREIRLDWLDPEVEWIEDPRYPGAETFHGSAGVERSVRKWWDAWEIEVRPQEFIDLGDRVVVLGHGHYRGGGSDVPLTAEFASVDDLRDGKIVRAEWLQTRAEAFRAVGLSE
jgi:ketosteroid isomerase-like protein